MLGGGIQCSVRALCVVWLVSLAAATADMAASLTRDAAAPADGDDDVAAADAATGAAPAPPTPPAPQ